MARHRRGIRLLSSNLLWKIVTCDTKTRTMNAPLKCIMKKVSFSILSQALCWIFTPKKLRRKSVNNGNILGGRGEERSGRRVVNI